MRLGEIEREILSQIGNGDWDYTKEKSELRRDSGYDPDVHIKVVRDGLENKDIPDSAIKKVLKRYQVSYSRALNRLISKGLIRRSWELHLDIGITPEQFKTVTIEPAWSEEKGLIIFFQDQFRTKDPEFDIPKCAIIKRICEYSLTDKGEKIKGERKLYNEP